MALNKRIDDTNIFVTDLFNVKNFKQSWLQTLTETAIETSLNLAIADYVTDIVDSNDPAPESERAHGASAPSSPTVPPDFVDFAENRVKFPNIDETLEKELEEVCDIKALLCSNESSHYEYASKRLGTLEHPIHNIPRDTGLVTLRLLEEELRKRWTTSRHGTDIPLGRFKHIYETYLKMAWKKEQKDTVLTVEPSDVILTVMICDPSHKYVKKHLRKGGLKYMVLGNQNLTELRDKIQCVSDIAVPGDFSHDPDAPQDIRAQDLFKSGFFYINGVFYNDMRDPSCRDYSKVITDWANSDPSRKLGPYQSCKMEDTTFIDLTIQLGYPYLYMHQGNCEHLMVFTDLRMNSPDDCMDRTQYPLYTSAKKKRRKLCMLCHVRTPKWITQNNDRLPLDPFFFCDICFRRFNYDDNGEKIGNFVAHPYLDRVAVF